MFKHLPLHYQLTLTVVAVVAMLLVSFSLLALWSNQNYHQEATQRLHHELATYIVEHQKQPLLDHGSVNHEALQQIAMQTMAINPLVEVFLLNGQGEVLGHALPVEEVTLETVDMAPILQRLQQDASSSTLVFGDNPRQTGEKRLFSVAPIIEDDQITGYLYVALNSQLAESIMEQLKGSHVAQVIVFAMLSLLLFAVLMLVLVFKNITQPVRSLSREINEFQQSDWMGSEGRSLSSQSELVALQQNFQVMQKRIVNQFNHLQENSRLRRELISNISHDLRTPLASLQGYIEALLLKREKLSAEEQNEYLNTAHRNSRRLAMLVSELFELSKLESGSVKPEMERFSLLELVYDVVNDYELAARELQVTLNIKAEKKAYQVVADIGLIQRVLQNLIDNALRFTPQSGNIDIRLEAQEGHTLVSVADSGFGIADKDLPHIFDAYYSIHNNPDSEAQAARKQGTGLGLAIVKRILELHDASIAVESAPGEGTCFRFQLGAA